MKRKIIFIVALLVMPLTTLVLASTNLNNQVVDSPVSMPVSYGEEFGINTYKGSIYSNAARTIKTSSGLEVDLIPIDSENYKTSQDLLNEFILENHGTAKILTQFNFSLPDKDIALRFYNVETGVFEVFSSIKTNNKSWLLHASISSESYEKLQNLINYKEFKSIISNSNFNNISNLNFERLDSNKVNTRIRDLDKQINNKFNMK